MNLLLLNTFDNEGGAAIATYRLHRGLRSIGIKSKLLVRSKKTTDISVIGPSTKWQKILALLRAYSEGFWLQRYHDRSGLFSSAWVLEGLASCVERLKPDVVHLFWVTSGFLRIETLRNIKTPIVWTLHDMWPFTGGCHYDNECGKFSQSCGDCPVLRSDREKDLSRQVWRRKQKAWRGLPIVVVATSHWLAEMARSSSLFGDKRVVVIPNGLDTEVYKPIDKAAARAAFNLPPDKHLVLFSAFNATSDKRKGSEFLAGALERMSKDGWGSKTELVIIGASSSEHSVDLGMKVHYIERLHDEISQVLLYSAADVVVAPSIQENLSNAVMESLACGTPVVAFDIGGMPDMIDHQENGYLAIPFDVSDLAKGIMWVLEDKNRHISLSHRACKTVIERFSIGSIARQYQALYQSLVN